MSGSWVWVGVRCRGQLGGQGDLHNRVRVGVRVEVRYIYRRQPGSGVGVGVRYRGQLWGQGHLHNWVRVWARVNLISMSG